MRLNYEFSAAGRIEEIDCSQLTGRTSCNEETLENGAIIKITAAKIILLITSLLSIFSIEIKELN